MTKIPEPAFAGADWSRDVSSLVRIVQGVLLPSFWTAEYGVSLSPERSDERHLRSVAQMIDRIRMLDDQPLSVCRSANARLIVVCRHPFIFGKRYGFPYGECWGLRPEHRIK